MHSNSHSTKKTKMPAKIVPISHVWLASNMESMTQIAPSQEIELVMQHFSGKKKTGQLIYYSIGKKKCLIPVLTTLLQLQPRDTNTGTKDVFGSRARWKGTERFYFICCLFGEPRSGAIPYVEYYSKMRNRSAPPHDRSHFLHLFLSPHSRLLVACIRLLSVPPVCCSGDGCTLGDLLLIRVKEWSRGSSLVPRGDDDSVQ
jgi:hypothetical protein